MKVPMILRWGLAWAALTGRYVSISYAVRPPSGGTYVFELQQAPKGWIRRRDRLRKKEGYEKPDLRVMPTREGRRL